MTEPPATPNPFAVSATRPGAIPYFFLDDTDVSELVGWLEDDGWRGQIIGPHGSGKSTLLAALTPHLRAAGRRVLHYTLHEGQRNLPEGLRSTPQDNEPTIVILDGYEQLRMTSQWCLRLVCRMRHWGLLVTAHQDMGLPTLWETKINHELAAKIIQRLLPDQPVAISPSQIAAAVGRHGQDLRSVLFELYDEYERARR